MTGATLVDCKQPPNRCGVTVKRLGRMAEFRPLSQSNPEKWNPVFRKDYAQTKS
jgi:hypothetical protein